MSTAKKLSKANTKLNEAIGRLIMFQKFPVVAEANKLVIDASNEIDEIINEILDI